MGTSAAAETSSSERSAPWQGRRAALRSALLCAMRRTDAERIQLAAGPQAYVLHLPQYNADSKCKQKPVASVDLEPSLIEQLEPILGSCPDTIFLQHSLERVTYDSRTREVGVTLVDGSHFGYTLPLANRPGVRRQFRQEFGRVPRVSRLMALALKFQGLLSERTVRNHAELAELGHVSRTRCARFSCLLIWHLPSRKRCCFSLKHSTAPIALRKTDCAALPA